jgi:hypothetical protein
MSPWSNQAWARLGPGEDEVLQQRRLPAVVAAAERARLEHRVVVLAHLLRAEGGGEDEARRGEGEHELSVFHGRILW